MCVSPITPAGGSAPQAVSARAATTTHVRRLRSTVGNLVSAPMPISLDHPLGPVLAAAVEGRFPPVDGIAEVVGPDADGTCAVVCFTGHAFVLTDLPTDEVQSFAPDGFGAAMHPALLLALAGDGREIGSTDVVLVRRATGGGSDLIERDDLADHPRVRRAFHHRRGVRVLGDERGLVTIGGGLVGRTEVSVELLDGAPHGAGAGRALIADALRAISVGEPVFAQVAAGNTASLRAFLAAGFTPVCSEVLIT